MLAELSKLVGEIGATAEHTGEVLDIRDVYGHDLSEAELVEKVDMSEFLISADAHVSLITSKGAFSIKRDQKYNRRG